MPELVAAPTRRPRWQFGLWYLFVLTTIAAVVAGVVQYLLAFPWLAIGVGVYVLGLAGYLLLRLPWVLGSLSPERQRLRENRRRWAEWADEQRAAIDNSKVSRDA